jgi:hypothetical protein
MLLEEGKTYPFRFVKTIEVGDEWFWVLIAPDEKKHLLNLDFYKGYNFREGDVYDCKVDKINCAGKIFLEPDHPQYQPGKLYDFDLKEIRNIVNSIGETETIVLVTDSIGNEAMALWPFGKKNLIDKSLELRVDRIKKGKLILSFPFVDRDLNHVIKGGRYKFIIDGISTLAPNREFFRLSDEKGVFHYIRHKYYQNYNFKVGQSIWCEVVNEPELVKYYLEPDYPEYEKGKSYEFDILREDIHYTADGGKREVLVVADKNRRECILFYDQDSQLESGANRIKARVMYCFKGKLFLRAQEMNDILSDSLTF